VTTTVGKGAGRSTASARTTKAAQRTPLPAKPTEKALLLDEAKQLGVAGSLSPRSTKADILAAIRVQAEKRACVKVQPASRQPAKASSSARDSEPPREGKAVRLKAALEPVGWKVSVKTGPGDRIEASAKRGTETLRQVWIDGAYDYGASQYTNGEVSRKVRNLSEAIRLYAVVVAI
jgi:hypothetical protein